MTREDENQLVSLDPYLDGSRAKRRHLVRKGFTRPALRALVKPRVYGEENVENLEGAFILIPNHQSHLDAPMVFSLLPDSITERLAAGAAADYFYRRKGVSALTSLFFNTYPIERKDKPRSPNQPNASGMTGRLLRAGVPLLIFPEGTRSRDGKIGKFRAGAAALAQKVGVPLVPLAMNGGHEAMPVGSVVPKFRAEVTLYIGKPMYSRAGESPEDFMARVFRVIEAMLEQKTAHPLDSDGNSLFD
ncbi:MAG: 1-acyl-sn-glycerol-3-phosphate acyltransferase [Actinomycetaceae bacterium]|nr:1-acyl-sn-glycerol-3-phosphate acyltransferase [Actinomycetaceae bacterium]